MNLTEPVQKMQKRCMSECCAKLFQAWCGIIFINGSFLVSAGSGGEQVETDTCVVIASCSLLLCCPMIMFYRRDPRTMTHLRKFVTTVRYCLHVFVRWLGNVKAHKDVCNCCIQQICDFAQLSFILSNINFPLPCFYSCNLDVHTVWHHDSTNNLRKWMLIEASVVHLWH